MELVKDPGCGNSKTKVSRAIVSWMVDATSDKSSFSKKTNQNYGNEVYKVDNSEFY